MKSSINWEALARDHIKELVISREIGYVELAKKLKSIGVEDTHINISNKINRGTFSLVFLLKVLEVLNLKMKFLNKEIKTSTVRKMNAIEFLDAYKKLNKISIEETTVDSTDLVFNKLNEAHKGLLRAVGASEELQEHILSSSFDDWSYHNKNLTEHDILDYYSYITKEQSTLNLVDNLIKETINEKENKQFSIHKVNAPIPGGLFVNADGHDSEEHDHKIFTNVKILNKDKKEITKTSSETVTLIEEISSFFEKEENKNFTGLKIIKSGDIVGPSLALAICTYWDEVILCHEIVDASEECSKIFTEAVK